MTLRFDKVSFFTVTFSSVTVWIGFYAWRIMFNNYAVEVFGASPTDVGLIQAVREVPGLLAFGAGALALYISESKIVAWSTVVLGMGLLWCGFSPTLIVLGLATMFMSFGFHYFEPTNSSQLLMLASPGQVGKAQGRLRSYESAAGLVGAALVLVLTLFLDYRVTFYLIGGAVTLVGMYLTFALPSNRSKQEKRKLVIKRKYWLYYSLSFLRGCRRHIFTTFAIFLFVKNHGLGITAIAAVMMTNSLITIFTHRWLGFFSDRFGERTVLALSSLMLIFIFTGYAYISYLPVLIALYLVDNILFGSAIALRSYLRKICPSEDLTSCLSFGMTANHVTAVVVPIIGGLAWSAFGHRTTFLAGAAIVFVDMLFALRIPSGQRAE